MGDWEKFVRRGVRFESLFPPEYKRQREKGSVGMGGGLQ